nr:hypothetical protein [Mariprofundus sp. KV]
MPSDGFITRLLQQAHHTAPKVPPASNQQAAKPDQMSISNEARQATESQGNHRLESKLMDLYNQKGNV